MVSTVVCCPVHSWWSLHAEVLQGALSALELSVTPRSPASGGGRHLSGFLPFHPLDKSRSLHGPTPLSLSWSPGSLWASEHGHWQLLEEQSFVSYEVRAGILGQASRKASPPRLTLH